MEMPTTIIGSVKNSLHSQNRSGDVDKTSIGVHTCAICTGNLVHGQSGHMERQFWSGQCCRFCAPCVVRKLYGRRSLLQILVLARIALLSRVIWSPAGACHDDIPLAAKKHV
eukprot:936693-Amphidinium_carterae.1